MFNTVVSQHTCFLSTSFQLNVQGQQSNEENLNTVFLFLILNKCKLQSKHVMRVDSVIFLDLSSNVDFVVWPFCHTECDL